MKLYLDGGDLAPPGWTKVYSIEKVMELMGANKVSQISMDFNIGDDYIGGGLYLLKKIVKKVLTEDFVPPKITIHCRDANYYRIMHEALDLLEEALFYGH